MSENTFRVQKEESWSIFKRIERSLKLENFFEDGLPVKYLPKTLFVCCILIIYIGNTHYAERTVREIERTKVEVDDLRADFTTLKSELMYAGKQSEVAKKVINIGLEESSRPPYKIIIKKGEY